MHTMTKKTIFNALARFANEDNAPALFQRTLDAVKTDRRVLGYIQELNPRDAEDLRALIAG